MDKTKKFFRNVFLILAGVFVVIMLFLYYANYSDGFRAGVPIKVSRKGKIIKTYEGEINVGGLTNTGEGVLPSTWAFSIKRGNDHVLQDLNTAIVGKQTGETVLQGEIRQAFLGWRYQVLCLRCANIGELIFKRGVTLF